MRILKNVLPPVISLLCVIPFLRADPIPVELIETDGVFLLQRDGEPYFIRGAGGSADPGKLADIGGNSIRTWGPPGEEMLDRAHELGLSVCIGLWIQHERHGFDYGDEERVREQIETHRRTIDRLKDHPAVLMWGIGNEVEIQSTDHRVWDTIEAVAAYAKKVDPHHPTMTVIAQADPKAVRQILKRCPSIDILGCNSYGGIGILRETMVEAGWEGPYIVTEWGNNGTWEVDKTDWGAEVEPTSTEKARQFAMRYGIIAGDRDRCLGGYVFHWGWKQETTPTWFNLFTEDGRAKEAVGVLQYMWSGKGPEAEAPRIAHLRINERTPESSLRVKPGSSLSADFISLDGEIKSGQVHWELVPESTDKRIGGDAEKRPDPVQLIADRVAPTHLDLKAPAQPGAYRLFLTVDGPGNTVATANFPFYVEAE